MDVDGYRAVSGQAAVLLLFFFRDKSCFPFRMLKIVINKQFVRAFPFFR